MTINDGGGTGGGGKLGRRHVETGEEPSGNDWNGLGEGEK